MSDIVETELSEDDSADSASTGPPEGQQKVYYWYSESSITGRRPRSSSTAPFAGRVRFYNQLRLRCPRSTSPPESKPLDGNESECE